MLKQIHYTLSQKDSMTKGKSIMVESTQSETPSFTIATVQKRDGEPKPIFHGIMLNQTEAAKVVDWMIGQLKPEDIIKIVSRFVRKP